ncbi:hypothetical protein K438DRAFT_1777548 [Mycena galopus ATCC 62051]|nr:hypothetical protein K438DRAFT_1777548 [Mycena galopus ATCC 62051]
MASKIYIWEARRERGAFRQRWLLSVVLKGRRWARGARDEQESRPGALLKHWSLIEQMRRRTHTVYELGSVDLDGSPGSATRRHLDCLQKANSQNGREVGRRIVEIAMMARNAAWLPRPTRNDAHTTPPYGMATSRTRSRRLSESELVWAEFVETQGKMKPPLSEMKAASVLSN